jgi:hypothetical protein
MDLDQHFEHILIESRRTYLIPSSAVDRSVEQCIELSVESVEQ